MIEVVLNPENRPQTPRTMTYRAVSPGFGFTPIPGCWRVDPFLKLRSV